MFNYLQRAVRRLGHNSPDQRSVIIHNHLFKNAGSSIDWALRKNFAGNFVDHRDDGEMLRGADYLGPYLLEHPAVNALSSHHLLLPLPVPDNVTLMMIVMFRHPVERVQSVYNFERRQKRASTPGAVHARKYGLREYVDWRMRPDVGETIRNFHTIKMLGAHIKTRKNNITEKDFAQAVDTVRKTEMIGLVERFDESMVLFEEFLRPFFPEIDLTYRIQNVGQSVKMSREDRVDGLRQEIGETCFKALLDKNRWDLKLHDIVTEEFMRRQGELKNFSQRLSDFKGRCEIIRP